MGKDRLAERRDLWAARHASQRRVIDLPDHPRLPSSYAPRRRAAAPPPRSPFKTFRLVSPIVMPLIMALACLLIVGVLALAPSGSARLAVGPEMLGPLVFIFAAVGVVIAAALAYATNDTIWALALAGGLLINGAVTIWAIFGPAPAVLLVFGVVAMLAVIVRAQAHTVLEQTAHVTVLLGKYHRTLDPGFHLRLPGEQIWAIVRTSELSIDVALTEVRMNDGAAIDIQAAAACRISRESAHLAADHASDWPDHARRCLELSLREVLREMAAADLLAGGAEIGDTGLGNLLATRLCGHMRHLAGSWGISVEWVRPHSWRAHHAPVSADQTLTRLAAGAAEPRIAIAYPAVAAPAPHSATPLTPPVLARPDVLRRSGAGADVAGMRGVTPGALLPLPPAMRRPTPVPAALAEAYAAVRERRITDPQTIARIAQAFETAALDPVLGPHLPFDATFAARHLRQLAHEMSRAG